MPSCPRGLLLPRAAICNLPRGRFVPSSAGGAPQLSPTPKRCVAIAKLVSAAGAALRRAVLRQQPSSYAFLSPFRPAPGKISVYRIRLPRNRYFQQRGYVSTPGSLCTIKEQPPHGDATEKPEAGLVLLEDLRHQAHQSAFRQALDLDRSFCRPSRYGGRRCLRFQESQGRSRSRRRHQTRHRPCGRSQR
jgi:hypothetical protein